jgi:hypothetical protein
MKGIKSFLALSVGVALVTAVTVTDVMAKGGKGQTLRLRDGSCNTAASIQRDRLKDRDRLRDRDQIMKQNASQDRDRLRDKDLLRQRDRIHQ